MIRFTLLLCVFLSSIIYSQTVPQSTGEKFNDRGFVNSASKSFSGNEVISDYDGNFSVAYSSNVDAPNNMGGEITLTYNSNVEHRVFLKGENSSGYPVNAPEWIIGYKGIALQTLNFEVNWYATNGASGLDKIDLSGEQVPLLIPGYSYTSRYWATEDQPYEGAPNRDYFQILMADGSKKIFYNKERSVVWTSKVDLGIYVENSTENPGYAKVEKISSGALERRIWYKPGNGLTYIFEEEKAVFADDDFHWDYPRIMYLKQINSENGDTLDFSYQGRPDSGYVVGRKLLTNISFRNGSTVVGSVLSIKYGDASHYLYSMKVINDWNNQSFTLDLTTQNNYTNWFNNTRYSNGSHRSFVTSITDNLGRVDYFKDYKYWGKTQVASYKYEGSGALTFSFCIDLNPLASIWYASGRKTDITYRDPDVTFDFHRENMASIYDFFNTTNRDDRTNLMVSKREISNKFTGVSQLTSTELFSYGGSRNDYNMITSGMDSGMTTTIVTRNENVSDQSAITSTVSKLFNRYPTNFRINFESDHDEVLKLIEEKVTSGSETNRTIFTWDYGQWINAQKSYNGSFLLKQKEVLSNDLLKLKTVYDYSFHTPDICDYYDGVGSHYLIDAKTETTNDSICHYSQYDNLINIWSSSTDNFYILNRITNESEYSLKNNGTTRIKDKIKTAKSYQYTDVNGWNKGKISSVYEFSDGKMKNTSFFYSNAAMLPNFAPGIDFSYFLCNNLHLGALIKTITTDGNGAFPIETHYKYLPDTIRTYMYDWGKLVKANGDTIVLYPPKWKYTYNLLAKVYKTNGSVVDSNVYVADFSQLHGKPFKTTTIYHRFDGTPDTLINYSVYENDNLIREIDKNGYYYLYDYDGAGRMTKAVLPGSFPVNTTVNVDTTSQKIASNISVENIIEYQDGVLRYQNPLSFSIVDWIVPDDSLQNTTVGNGPPTNPTAVSSVALYFKEQIITSNIKEITNAVLHIEALSNESKGAGQSSYFNIYAITDTNSDGSPIVLFNSSTTVSFVEHSMLNPDLSSLIMSVKSQNKPLLGFMLIAHADYPRTGTSLDTCKKFSFDGQFKPILDLTATIINVDSTIYKGSVVYKYDDDNNTVTMTKRMNFDPLNPKQIVTKQEFDGLGQPRTTLVKNNSDNLEVKSTATYNFLGLKSSEKDAKNRASFFKYDGFQRVNTVRFQTDESTAPKQTINYYICANPSDSAYEYKEIIDEEGKTTKQYFDKFGNMVREQRGDLITRFYYDNLNRLDRVVTPMGKTTKYAYDSLGNLASKTTPDEGTTRYKYDTKGNLRFSVNDSAIVVGDPLVFIKYDEFKRPYLTGLLNSSYYFSVLDANFDYYVDHNSVPHFENYATDTSKFVTVNMYDNYIKTGVFTNMTNPPNFSIVQNNNLKGRLVATAFRDKLGMKWNYKVYCYDARGNVSRFWVKYENQAWREIDNEYDHMGNLTKQSVIPDFYYWYDYDNEGHLKEVRTNAANNKLNAKLEAVYTYNAAGQDSTLTYPSITNSLVVNNSYNSRGWLEQVAVNNTFSEQLTFTPNGNVDKQTINYYNFNPTTFDTLKMSYTYDDVNRLTFSNNTKVMSGYEIYSYDGDGNLLTKSRSGNTMVYNYVTGKNTLSSVYKNGTGNNYTFNYKGNLTFDGLKTLTNFTYDHRNLPLGLTKTGWSNIVYSYDDKGERILKKTASVNEYYLRDHTGRELAIYDLSANRIKMANIFGNGLIGRVDVNWVQTSGFYWDENHMKVFYTTTTRSDDRCYYLKDHLGSNRMTINSLGVVTNVQDYYAYGEVLRSYNNSTPNEKYKFTGKERDTETDLDYFGARYYDSELGRWLSIDRLTHKYPQWSPYNYCLDNPVRLFDPDGKEVKVFSEKLGSATMWRGGGIMGLIGSFLNPRHSYLQVKTDKINVILELGGPLPGLRKGNPIAKDIRYETGERPDQMEHKVTRPSGVSESDFSFENKILDIFLTIEKNLPDYDGKDGPNSNGFVKFLIEAAGGQVNLSDNAFGKDEIQKYFEKYNEEKKKEEEKKNEDK